MKKVLKLEGLNCANCAAKIEKAVGSLSGVNSATLNFVTTKLVIEATDTQMDRIINDTQEIVRKLEPDVIVKKA
ncbi:MAG: cation transporter [Erysipelotrichaceae bacterium]|nr:cation transporter [Erysipelotrichaceae bacterium]